MLRDILAGKDAQLAAVRTVLNRVDADVLLLTNMDWDHDLLALRALSDSLTRPLAHHYAPRPNSGLPTGLDIDQNNKLGEARDAQGYGRFSGDGGMALLSRYPIDLAQARDYSANLWADFPNGLMAKADVGRDVQRLSTTGHWAVPVQTPTGIVTILAFAATPPVFDGPEDRNGRRNHDEIMFWHQWIDQNPNVPFVIAGLANLDPIDGQGLHTAIANLLTHPRLFDPLPHSAGARAAGNPGHGGHPALDTVDLSDPTPGNLRLSYVLPSRDLPVLNSGVAWPDPENPDAEPPEILADRHRLVWVDLAFP